MPSTCTRGRATIGNHVLNGTVATVSDREFSASDMFAEATSQVVGFADIGNCTVAITHPILSRLGRRFLSNPGSGVVFVGTTRFVDCHLITSFCYPLEAGCVFCAKKPGPSYDKRCWHEKLIPVTLKVPCNGGVRFHRKVTEKLFAIACNLVAKMLQFP